ncbi:MAG: hypothetical protein LBV71_08620 [Prevotella sp.]|nr:hypothetical protein [Prevotella sp.]
MTKRVIPRYFFLFVILNDSEESHSSLYPTFESRDASYLSMTKRVLTTLQPMVTGAKRM